MTSPRNKITFLLVAASAILAFIPEPGKYSLHGRSENLLSIATSIGGDLSPDQIAKAVVTNDSTLQIIDLRSKEEYEEFSIPGTINIPYRDFLETDFESLLNNGLKNVFVSNDDYQANYAYILSQGLGFTNCGVMKGGLNEWKKTIMNSSFSGERITARENALFEVRYKVRDMVNEYHNLPDSIKVKYYTTKEIERKKLDGGCE
jgi:rhodanese-related sulfurtransferase